MPYTAAVVTLSASSAAGKREDLSGPAVRAALDSKGFQIVATIVVKDDRSDIQVGIIEMCHRAQLVVTTGGTGIAERDVTPEATRAVADREVEGIGERMR